MCSSQPVAASVTASEVALMSDAELGLFMRNHRTHEGGYQLPVSDWNSIPAEQLALLAERLKAQERILAQSSQPLDLEHLDARLRGLPVDQNFSLSAGPRATAVPYSPTPSPPDYAADERMSYEELLNDGGRPLYPIHLLDDVFEKPEQYADLLQPWQSLSSTDGDRIFHDQKYRWTDFRRWQNDNRDIDDDEGGNPAYVEREKFYIQRDWGEKRAAKLLAQIAADPSRLKPDWDDLQEQRSEQRYLCRERGCEGFIEYADAVKRRLATHGFTRPLQLHEDAKKQDQITTWIEYLNYEYWWLDRYVRAAEHFKPTYDRAWEELVQKEVLRPNETRDFVWSESGMQQDIEERRAERAIKLAENAVRAASSSRQEDSRRQIISEEKRTSMLQASEVSLDTARHHLQNLRARWEPIGEYFDAAIPYKNVMQDVDQHRGRITWVLSQIPLIDEEMGGKKTDNLAPGTRKRSASDEGLIDERSAKRSSRGSHSSGSVLHRTGVVSPSAVDIHSSSLPLNAGQLGSEGSQAKATTTRKIASPAPTELRRSARIAALQAAVQQEPKADVPAPETRSSGQVKATETPKARKPTKDATSTKRNFRSGNGRIVSKVKEVTPRPQRRRRGR